MFTLVSVNVGLPREIEWQGKLVRTAIWKRSIPQRVLARRLNLDGDGQGDLAGHGGEQRAVMVYQLDSYRYWQSNLHRNDFEYGQFGENFTVEGLSDNEVCIGDRYRIGSAVFEVTQPRVTCYRVGIRMKDPQMPSLLVSHHRPGFYLRVIEEGEVGAGDEIRKVTEGPGKVSVAEVDSLLYLPGAKRERLETAARIPALSPGWKYSLEELLKADQAGVRNGNAGLTSSVSPPPAWPGFRTLRVEEVRHETKTVSSLVLQAEDKSQLPPALPGQYLALRLHPNSAETVLRSYSISGPPDSGMYRISVKRGDGDGSRYIVDSARAGEPLEVSAPRGDFLLRPGELPIVLISAGIGLTPVLSMLHALSSPKLRSSREVWWLHGARNGKEHVLAEEVRGLLGTISGSHSLIVYSQPAAEDHLGDAYDASGHLDLSCLQKMRVPVQAEFYLCGPNAFLASMKNDLASYGVPAAAVHEEIFGSTGSIEPGVVKTAARSPHPPVGFTGTGPRVAFTRSGLSVPWDNRFKSLLEFAEACDVPVKWSCRTGVCHTCECGLLDGSLRYSPEPLDQPAKGNALICCSTPLTEIDLDL